MYFSVNIKMQIKIANKLLANPKIRGLRDNFETSDRNEFLGIAKITKIKTRIPY
jgi:hypothetical protein